MNGSAQPPSPVERLGPYELIAPLGIGGMAEVHRARDTRLGREVAVKILDFEAARQPERLRLFEHEARAASALNHPAIVSVHDVGREGDVPYVVLELVEGETLQRRLLRGRLPHRKAIEIAVQIGQGLAAAHARGILHNDLKPANVILTGDGRVKILDFGLAGLRSGSSGRPSAASVESAAGDTVTQALFGTAGYIAPERIAGAPPDARSDVFALGAVLYEMVAGRPAFPGETTAQILTATTELDPPPFDPPVPAPLARVVERALEKQPAQRFQSASDLAYALEAVGSLSGGPLVAGRRPRWRRLVGRLLAALALMAAGVGLGRLLWPTPVPSFQRLTFRFGAVSAARFAPDGRTVIYSSAWDGEPQLRLYSARTDTRGATELGAPAGDVAAVSSSGELAFFPGRPYPALYHTIMSPGDTLARVPITGGAPREVLPDVVAADWAPADSPAASRGLAVIREHGGLRRLEYPIGHLLYQSSYGLRAPRFSPDGRRIAVFESSPAGDCVSVVGLDGSHRVLARDLTFTSSSLAWSRDGGEVWFTAEKQSEHPRYGSWRPALRAVSLSGRERLLLRVPEYLSLQDASDGRVLATIGSMRSQVLFKPRDETSERNLSWHEGSSYTELSRDGRALLFFEQGEYATYLRPTDGRPAVRLCEGQAAGLSPDGRWVVRMEKFSGRLELVPTQAGEPRAVAAPRIEPWAYYWFNDGRRLLLAGNEAGHALRAWMVDTASGASQVITPEGVGCWLVSPDGETAACARPEQDGFLYPVGGGEPRPIPGFVRGDHMRQWSADGRHLFVSERYARPARVFRLDLTTGERQLWREFAPPRPEGVVGTIDPAITPDGSAWAYAVLRHLNDLYLVEGVQ